MSISNIFVANFFVLVIELQQLNFRKVAHCQCTKKRFFQIRLRIYKYFFVFLIKSLWRDKSFTLMSKGGKLKCLFLLHLEFLCRNNMRTGTFSVIWCHWVYKERQTKICFPCIWSIHAVKVDLQAYIIWANIVRPRSRQDKVMKDILFSPCF